MLHHVTFVGHVAPIAWVEDLCVCVGGGGGREKFGGVIYIPKRVVSLNTPA